MTCGGMVGEGKKELAVLLDFCSSVGGRGVGQYMARLLFSCLLAIQQWDG